MKKCQVAQARLWTTSQLGPNGQFCWGVVPLVFYLFFYQVPLVLVLSACFAEKKRIDVCVQILTKSDWLPICLSPKVAAVGDNTRCSPPAGQLHPKQPHSRRLEDYMEFTWQLCSVDIKSTPPRITRH